MKTGIKRIYRTEWDQNQLEPTHDSDRSSHTGDPDIWEHFPGHDTEEVPSGIYAGSI